MVELTAKTSIPRDVISLCLYRRKPEHIRMSGCSGRVGRGNKRTVDEREVMNGLMYVLSTGCQWRAMPKDLPPRSTVNFYFCRWQHDGTLDRLHHALYVLCREQAGREASPTAAIIDSQSVKGAEKGGAGSMRQALMAARKSRARNGTSSSIRRAY